MIKSTFNRTKIIATIGPAIESEEMLLKLIMAGVDVFRLNFSHSDYGTFLKVIERIKKINYEKGFNIALLADLQGPKIRIGEIETGQVEINKGDILTIVNKIILGNKKIIGTNYKSLAKDVKKNHIILVDDGNLVFSVIQSNNRDSIKVKVIHGGLLKSKKGMNFPNTHISSKSLTPKDKDDIDFILNQDIEWIALSFVRKAEDVLNLRKIIIARGKNTRVIAKIEKPEAIKNIDEIIHVSDAIMVARGDLGVEIHLSEVPLVQKMIVHKSNQAAKPVIIATQMMESMITKHVPTRAETNDIANAVLDGADAMMLSAETSVGVYPVETVQNMVKTIAAVENSNIIYNKEISSNPQSKTYKNDRVVSAACRLAADTNAKVIVGFTTSGYTAYRLAVHRPKAFIFIFSNNRSMLNTLNLAWGVRTIFYDKFVSTDQTIKDISGLLSKLGYLKNGDVFITTASMPIDERKLTNTVKLGIFEEFEEDK